MEGSSAPALNLQLFETFNFNIDEYVKKVAQESIYASNIVETKEKLIRVGQQTAEEIKQNVYKNYANFMETAKEVGHLEGKMSQLRQSLDEQRKLLSLFKNLNTNSSNSIDLSLSVSPNSINNLKQKSSLAILLEQVEGCGLITQKSGRSLLFHSDLEALHTDDYSVSHKLHAYLLSDALLLTLPQRKRSKAVLNTSITGSVPGVNRFISNPIHQNESNKLVESSLTNNINNSSSKNSYQYKFQALYELQDVKIMNIYDSKEVRNSFQLLKFPESLAFRCANAHLKKEWLESIENAKKQLDIQDEDRKYIEKGSDIIEEEDEGVEDNEGHERHKSLANLSEYERGKVLRELFSDFDILLAQRDFEKAVDMLLKIKQSTKPDTESTQSLIYKQKETELINILRKDLVSSKERGNNKGVVKTGKRVVNSLIRLKIYDEAIDLFIDYHKHLNAETLRKIKLEESNAVYMNNVLNLFFENLRISFVSFGEVFGNLFSFCFSTYLSWCDTEIEILIKKLQSQHYLGRHFDLTIENCDLIFVKASEFSLNNKFDVRFLFESKLSSILEATIKEQLHILVEASFQRTKLEFEGGITTNEQNRQIHIEKLTKDLNKHELLVNFNETELQVINASTSCALQFSRGVIDFFCDCLRVYYQDINFCIIETFTKLFKLELKIYAQHLKRNTKENEANKNRLKKDDILNNVCCIEKMASLVEMLYFNKTGVRSKNFLNLVEKFAKFKEENFS